MSISDTSLQMKAVEEIIKKELNVRDTELLVKRLTKQKTLRKKETTDVEYGAIEERFREVFGTKVKIMNNKKNGKILIEYYSMDELDRIITLVERMDKNSKK